MDFMGGYGIFVVGAIAIIILVGILIFLRSRKTDE
jgi:heme exporter protein D